MPSLTDDRGLPVVVAGLVVDKLLQALGQRCAVGQDGCGADDSVA